MNIIKKLPLYLLALTISYIYFSGIAYSQFETADINNILRLESSKLTIFSKAKEIATNLASYNPTTVKKQFESVLTLIEESSHKKLRDDYLNKEIEIIKLLKKEQEFSVNNNDIMFVMLNFIDEEKLYATIAVPGWLEKKINDKKIPKVRKTACIPLKAFFNKENKKYDLHFQIPIFRKSSNSGGKDIKACNGVQYLAKKN